MSEIGEKAKKIWREKTEIIRRKKELVAAQAKEYASLILDIFAASNEQGCVSTVTVYYYVPHNHLSCCVQFFDIDGKTCSHTYTTVVNDKLMKTMNIVNAIEVVDGSIITNIYNELVADSQVTKYFEVIPKKSDDEIYEIKIKMRPKEDTVCN